MQRSWIAACALSVVAVAGGLVASRALAEEDPMAGGGAPPMEKCVDGHGLVKALTASKWTTKSTSEMGNGAGTTTFHLGAGKTLMLQEYDSKSTMGDYAGHGVYKIGADGKTATLWWFNSMSPKPEEYTGQVTDTGFELSGDTPSPTGGMAKSVLRLVKKGEDFEFTFSMDGKLIFTDVYSKAK